MVQYWKSFVHLERYAKSKNAEHLPAWSKFNKSIGSKGDVGIWYETYVIDAGNYECIYNNMPVFGLAKAGKHTPLSGSKASARQRINS